MCIHMFSVGNQHTYRKKFLDLTDFLIKPFLSDFIGMFRSKPTKSCTSFRKTRICTVVLFKKIYLQNFKYQQKFDQNLKQFGNISILSNLQSNSGLSHNQYHKLQFYHKLQRLIHVFFFYYKLGKQCQSFRKEMRFSENHSQKIYTLWFICCLLLAVEYYLLLDFRFQFKIQEFINFKLGPLIIAQNLQFLNFVRIKVPSLICEFLNLNTDFLKNRITANLYCFRQQTIPKIFWFKWRVFGNQKKYIILSRGLYLEGVTFEQWPDFGCEGIKVQRAHQPTSQCQGKKKIFI
eukprot:TRINITY_DN19708_c0_g1_i1.p1 TRINITY_DN19708_c0_g1~~TRINITY_DN19708_c0_g1_i1.p1  ORF type:complete len:291 (-),score=-6.47 TRINITY_DN19708_c0_g1_i1:147-1019(-)